MTVPGTEEEILVRLWRQTNQERPFTTRLFREADCAIYIADITGDVDNTRKNLAIFNEMLDRECREDVHRVMICNKADLQQKRRILATEGMTMVIENGMHRYFEVSAIKDYKVTSTLSDVIRTIHESKRPVKL